MESSDEISGGETVAAHKTGDNRKDAGGKITKKRKRKKSWMLNTINGTKVSLEPSKSNLLCVSSCDVFLHKRRLEPHSAA